MPTTRIRYVDAASTNGDGTTRATSGANAAYSSIRAALVAEYAATPNLVTSDILLNIQCVGTGADGSVAIGAGDAPFVTDATRYLLVETPLGDRGPTPWIWSTSRYRWSVAQGGTMWAMRNNKVVLRGLQWENSRNNTDAGMFGPSPNAGGTNITIEECHFRFVGAANAGTLISIGQTSGPAVTVKIRNNLLVGTTPSNTGNGISIWNDNTGNNVQLDSNTVIGMKGTGIAGNATYSSTARDNLVKTSSGTCFGSGLTQSYNASSDGTASGTGSRASQTFTFTNEGSGDYSLSASDAGARTYGTDLSGDANNPFSTDIRQQARGAVWDIGAYQVTVAAAGRPPYEGLIRGLARGMRSYT